MTTRWTADDIRATGLRVHGNPVRDSAAMDPGKFKERLKSVPKSKEERMSKTERRYRFEILDRRDDVARVVYEGITIHLDCGKSYTPDWIVVRKDGRIECHEVKGKFKLQSYRSAQWAFAQSRVEWPCFVWVWAEADGGSWNSTSLP